MAPIVAAGRARPVLQVSQPEDGSVAERVLALAMPSQARVGVVAAYDEVPSAG